MNPYRKRQRRKLQRARAVPRLHIINMPPLRDYQAFAMQQIGRGLRTPIILSFSNPVGRSWIYDAFAQRLR